MCDRQSAERKNISDCRPTVADNKRLTFSFDLTAVSPTPLLNYSFRVCGVPTACARHDVAVQHFFFAPDYRFFLICFHLPKSHDLALIAIENIKLAYLLRPLKTWIIKLIKTQEYILFIGMVVTNQETIIFAILLLLIDYRL